MICRGMRGRDHRVAPTFTSSGDDLHTDSKTRALAVVSVELTQQPRERDSEMITIQSLHNGPPRSAHGGVAAGQMAALIDAERAVVRFHAPPPLGEPLTGVSASPDEIDVLAGQSRIAIVRPTAPIEIEPFEPLGPMAVAVAESRWLDDIGRDHPFPTCFGCGTGRSDGLGLMPGLVPGTSTYATFWTPDVDGPVPSWLVWAALDCPSGGPALASVASGGFVVTGELGVEIFQPLDGAQRYQILSRCLEQSGRVFRTQAAIVDETGANVAVAAATWIAVSPDSAVAS